MRAKKSLGQNFIHDQNFLVKLNKKINSDSNTNIIEIGPGRGALTTFLVKKNFKKLFLIEKDNKLANNLDNFYENNKKITVKNKDALDFDLLSLPINSNCIIVGNLPFNISSQLLIKWISTSNWPPFYTKMYLMFQKELGERIIAESNSKSYGRISVLSQARCKIKKILTAPSSIFYPKPKVDAVVLEFIPIEKYKNINVNKLKLITKKAFHQRRKKIKSSLKEYRDLLENNSFDLDVRAENLSVNDFCKITNLI